MAASLHSPFKVEQIIGLATQGSRLAATLGYLVKALRASVERSVPDFPRVVRNTG